MLVISPPVDITVLILIVASKSPEDKVTISFGEYQLPELLIEYVTIAPLLTVISTVRPLPMPPVV